MNSSGPPVSASHSEIPRTHTALSFENVGAGDGTPIFMLIELSSKTRLALLFYSRSSRDSVRLLRPFFFPFVAQTECVSLVHLPPSVFKLAFGYFHHFCFFVEVFLFFHQAQGSLQLTTESFGTGLLKTFLLNNSKIEFFSMLASITLFQISVFLVLGMTGVFLLYCEMLI